MAKQESRFVTGSMTDQRYPTDGIAEYFKQFMTSGLWRLDTSLAVSAAGGLVVNVNYGDALVNGYIFRVIDDNNGELPLTVAAGGAQPRIDRVVIRFDAASETVTVVIKGGTPDASPVAPALTRTAAVYEISLAQIAIAANQTEIVTGDITDERASTSVCGQVTNSLSGPMTLDSMPIGFSMPWFVAALPSSKWLAGEGQSLAAYPDAAAVYGENLPDTRDRTLVGQSTSGTFGTLGASVGAETSTALLAHTHTNNHDHPAGTSGADATHTHPIPQLSGSTSNPGNHVHYLDHDYDGAGGTNRYTVHGAGYVSGGAATSAAGSHTHTVTTSASTTGTGSSHTHSFDVAAYTGDTGSAGSGSSFSLVQPSIVCRWIFKVQA